MKAFGVAALLIIVGLATACPQAGQFFAPNGGFTADAPKTEEAGVKDDEIPPPDAEAPAASPAFDKEPIATPPPSENTSGGGGGEPKDQYLASGKPIDPKSDDYFVDDFVWTFADARLRYDKAKNFQTVLSPTVTPKLVLPQNGAIDFPAISEVTEKGEGITPWIDSIGYSIRMIFWPENNPGKPVYCDAKVFYSKADGNVRFTGVTAGRGLLSFYHPIPASEAMKQPSIDSDPPALCSLGNLPGGWKALLKEAALADEWIHLGSFRTELLVIRYQPDQGPVKAKPVFILP